MHILIAEDEARVANLIKRGLEEYGYTATVAFDGEIAKKLVLNNQYDLIITDINLPKLNGIDLCRHIRSVFPSMPIIMLTALGTTDDKVEGFDAGANDYMVKPFDLRELHVRIRELLKRNVNQPNNGGINLRFADLEMNLNTKRVFRDQVEINLTPKEFKLLEYMMQNPNRVLTRVEIAEKVWETTFDTGTNFIDVYINYLRNKVDKNFSTKLIHTKSGMGFILQQMD